MNKILKAIQSTILCLRFPFLYPRNRFTDKHYNNWTLQQQIKLFRTIEKDTLCVNCVKESEVDKKCESRFITINATNYQIYKEYKTNVWYVGSSYNDKTYIINSDILDNGEVKYFTFNTLKKCLNIVVSDDAKVKQGEGFHLVTLQEHKFVSFIIKTLNICENFLGLFHCIPTYTELDAMPDGWRKRFGIKMCKEIRKDLIKCGWKYLFNYRIAQIKEKYGTLRWYDAQEPKDSKIFEITQKYEDISSCVCINCGKDAKWISKGWISPYCDDCVGDTSNCEEIK